MNTNPMNTRRAAAFQHLAGLPGKRLSLAITGFALVVIAMLWTGVAAIIRYDRAAATDAWTRETGNLARTLQEHTVRTLNYVDELALQVKRQYETQGKRLDMAKFFADAMVNPALIINGVIADTTGFTIMGSAPDFTPVNLADREHVKVHAERDTGALFISKPVLARVAKRWSIIGTRRINKPDGGYGGVAGIGIDPFYFTNFYKDVDLGNNSVVALVGMDGIVRASLSNAGTEIGQDLGNSELLRRARTAAQGSYSTVSVSDGVTRLFGYRVLRDYPLIVTVGVAEETLFAESNYSKRYYYGGAGFMTLVIALIAGWLLALNARAEGAATEVLASRERYRRLIEESPDATLIHRGETVLYANPAALKLLGASTPEQVVGRSYLDFVGARDHAVARAHSNLVESGAPYGAGELRERQYVRLDGSMVDVEISVARVQLADVTARQVVVRDISARKRAEAALRDSEARLHLAIAAADMTDWEWHVETDVTYWGEGRSHLLGPLPTGATHYPDFRDMVHIDDRERFLAAARATLANDVPYEIEFRIIRTDRRVCWLRNTGRAVRDAQGRVERLIGVTQNVTRHHAIEAELAESHRRRDALLESIPASAWLKDRYGRFIAANRAWFAQRGVTPHDIAGKIDSELFDAARADMQMEEDGYVIEHQAPLTLERQRVVNGETIWTEVVKTPVLDYAGNITGIVGISHDITARKYAEREVHEARLFLDSVIENIPDMIFVKDAGNLRFVRLNKAGEALLGHAREELLGKSDYDFFPREQADFFVAKDREVLAGGALVDIPQEAIQTATQGERLLHTKKIPLVDQSGRPRFLLGISEDVTERLRAEQEIKSMNATLADKAEQLATANQELEAFSYSVSHDLRAPLRGIDGWSHALLEDYGDKLDKTGRGYLEKVRAEASRMGQLIDAMLTLGRTLRLEITRQRVDLSALAAAAVATLRRSDPARAVDVQISEALVCAGDSVLLNTVVENLIGNAWKFTGRSAHARIEFGAETAAGETVFHVRDNGAGFDEKHAAKLFGAFQRLHRASEFEGTGIGLVNVQRIIRRHGGRIWAKARPQEGATFFFTIGSPK